MRPRSGVFACLALLVLTAQQAFAADDDYPRRQIKIIVPFPGGAGPDQVARLLGKHLQDAFGQPVVIENRAGALGSIGAAEVAHSAPDGYTLLMGTNTTQASNVATLKNLAYDPAKDFSPIIRTTTTAMVLMVKPDFPARDLSEFLNYAGAHHLTAGYGSGASQISVAQLQSRGGMTLVAASYRGVPQAMTDVIAGVIDLTFGDFSVAIPQMQGGTLRGIGVTCQSATSFFRICPRWRKRCRASKRRSGTDCSRPPIRPSRSSGNSMRRARNSCRRRRPNNGSPMSASSSPPRALPNSANSSKARSCAGPRTAKPPALNRNRS